MTFHASSRTVKHMALTGLFALFSTNSADLQGRDRVSGEIQHLHAMAEQMALHKDRMLETATRPLTIEKFVTARPVAPLAVDSVAGAMAPLLGFSAAYQDKLAKGMHAYQQTQGYKYFDVAAQYVLSDLNIRNQTFMDVAPRDQGRLDSAGLVNRKTNRLIAPVYTAHPRPDYLAATPQEKLHKTHWQTALNFSVIGYADTLAKATWAGVVRDSTSWQNWHRDLIADKGFVPGAAGRVDELGAYCDQHYGTFSEETERLRGVNEGRHGGSSEHYSAKFAQRQTPRSEAIDIFGPGRNYGYTKLLDSLYQHQILPHRDILGVPRALVDTVRSKTEDNRYVNPGRAVWYFRGHYGDHIHVSATRQCATLYAGAGAVAAQDQKRRHITQLFNGNKPVPAIMPYKILDPDKNVIVITRDSIVPLNPHFPAVQNVQALKSKLMAKAAKPRHKAAKSTFTRHKKTVTSRSRAASRQPAVALRTPRND